MADIKISEMTTAATLNGTEVSVLSQSQGGQLVSVKATLQAIANWFAVNAEYTSALNTTDKRICGAINELKQLISLIPQFSIEVVQTLPTEDISDTTIYLVPAEDPEVGNYYEEYIHVNNTWELVGSTAVDLSNYYTKTQADGKFAITVANTISPTNLTKKVADISQNNVTTPVYSDDADKILREAFGEHIVTGNPVSVDAFLGLEVPSECKVTMNPIQDLSHGDPSPTNICPISGRDSVTVKRTGKNLFGGTALRDGIEDALASTTITDTTISFSAGATVIQPFTENFKFEENTQYTFIFTGENSSASASNIRVAYTDGTTYDNLGNFGTSKKTNIYQTTAGKTVERISKRNSGGSTTIYFNESGIFKGLINEEDFEPYTAETHTHTYSSTVYGGVDDFVSGEGSSEWGHIASYNGETLPSIWLSDRDVYAPNTSPTTGAEVVYKLATPTQITNTPEDISLLKGVNVVSTDGDSIELKYSADIKAYIDSKLNA